jgi:hypothetical protein
MKSLHRLIPFLPLLRNHLWLPSPELTQFLTTSNSNDLLCPFITLRHGPHRKQPLYCWESFFTDPLISNGRPIVARTLFRGNVFTESLPGNDLYVAVFVVFIINERVSNNSIKNKYMNYSNYYWGKKFFSSPQFPDRLWVPPSLLSNVYLELFPRS